MGRVAQEMVKDVLDAYANRDVDKAVAVWNRDEELDEMYSSLFRELAHLHDGRSAQHHGVSTHLLFIAKNIERIGDHATNVAEMVHYLVRGTQLSAVRPKGDATSFAVVRPEADDRGA